MNTTCLTARLVRDPESRYTASNVLIVRFTVAVDRQRKDANGNRQVDFVRCSAFGKTGEFVSQFLHKGRLVAIDGSLHINSVTQADGTKKEYAEVVCNSVQALDYDKTDKPDEPHQPEAQVVDEPDDVPFAN